MLSKSTILALGLAAVATVQAASTSNAAVRREEITLRWCNDTDKAPLFKCAAADSETACAAIKDCMWCGDTSPLAPCANKKVKCALPTFNVELEDGTHVNFVNAFTGDSKQCAIINDMTDEEAAFFKSPDYTGAYFEFGVTDDADSKKPSNRMAASTLINLRRAL